MGPGSFQEKGVGAPVLYIRFIIYIVKLMKFDTICQLRLVFQGEAGCMSVLGQRQLKLHQQEHALRATSAALRRLKPAGEGRLREFRCCHFNRRANLPPNRHTPGEPNKFDQTTLFWYIIFTVPFFYPIKEVIK
jgi:hypothetical protein